MSQRPGDGQGRTSRNQRPRVTGCATALAVPFAEYRHEQYLISTLGNDAHWVRNVRATDGRAVLRCGRREQVRLEEVESAGRAPILRRYLAVARRKPGQYMPVDRHAPLEEFERIAAQFPVFRIAPAASAPNYLAKDALAAH